MCNVSGVFLREKCKRDFLFLQNYGIMGIGRWRLIYYHIALLLREGTSRTLLRFQPISGALNAVLTDFYQIQ